MTWSNDKLSILANSLITEYDIRQANVSVMDSFGLLPAQELDRLRALPKDQRNRTVGLMIRDSKELAKKLETGFNTVVKSFIQANDLDTDVDVTDIRRDAVFVVNRPIKFKTFAGGKIQFVQKNRYHAMLKLQGNLGFFFRVRSEDEPSFSIVVDGLINKQNEERDDVIAKLTPGPLALLNEFVDVVESTNFNRFSIYKWLIEVADLYKRRQLDLEYYRELTRNAMFHLRDPIGDSSYVDYADESMIEDLDISYNFTNVIIPLLRLVV